MYSSAQLRSSVYLDLNTNLSIPTITSSSHSTTTRNRTKTRMTTTSILLLKTKSHPHDNYQEFFSARGYSPAFIPVLEHQFNNTNLQTVRELFESGELNPGPARKYGGIIFTSQRAVEGFAKVVEEVGVSKTSEASHSLFLYTVGPATSRTLGTLRDSHLPHAPILGADTGNGENLAQFILEHYNTNHTTTTDNDTNGQTQQGQGQQGKKPLLFLVGEQHRDVIPKTLRGETEKENGDRLSAAERIGVDEVVVYGTCVKKSFEGDFAAAVSTLSQGGDGGGRDEETVVWVVVFSPTGCDAMLRVLKLGNQSGHNNGTGETPGNDKRRVFVATIGPTTRDHLRLKYGFEPDVCAEKPSQDGVGDGIERFMDEWRKGRKEIK